MFSGGLRRALAQFVDDSAASKPEIPFGGLAKGSLSSSFLAGGLGGRLVGGVMPKFERWVMDMDERLFSLGPRSALIWKLNRGSAGWQREAPWT